MKNVHEYEKATDTHPLMGLDNKVCINPKYWCRLHQVWLSEEDVLRKKCKSKLTYDLISVERCNDLEEDNEKLERAKMLARKCQNYENYIFPKPKIDELSVRGIPLKNKFCKGYTQYNWTSSENKPNFDKVKVQYCYVGVTKDNIELKIQVLLDHEVQMVYVDTESLASEYANVVIEEVQRIINS